MEQEEPNKIQKWIKVAKQQIEKWLIGGVLAIIATGISFYYNTNSTLSAHQKTLDEIKEKVDNVITVPILQQEKINSIEETVKEIKNNQTSTESKYDSRLNRMEQRQDDIYMLILEISKKKQ